jgi:hypothetical protein
MFTPDSIVKAAGMLIALSVSSAAYGQAAPGQYGFGTDATPQELAKFLSIPAMAAACRRAAATRPPARRSTPSVAVPVTAASSRAIPRRASAAIV